MSERQISQLAWVKCSWAPGWCWSQAKGSWERERRLTQAEMWGWRAAGDSLCESSLLVPVSLLLVSRALPHRGSGKAANTHKIKQCTGTTEIFYFELTLFLKLCCRVTSWFFVWLKLRQRFQLSVDFVSFDLFWTSILVCLHSVCVYENLLQFVFVLFVRGEGDCFVRPISVFYNIIAILIDLFCCLNDTFLSFFTNLNI